MAFLSRMDIVGAGMEAGLPSMDFVATSGRRFSRVRVAQGPATEGDLGDTGRCSAVIAAGTHTDPCNSVTVWNASVAGDVQLADRLLDHDEAMNENQHGARPRPPLSHKMKGDVASLEFWGGPQRGDGSLRLWAGSSDGTVSLLSAQRYEGETDDQRRPLEAWQVNAVATAERSNKPKAPLHSQAASALAVLPTSTVEVLSAGEDGKVWSLACDAASIIANPMGRADSVAIYDIKFADMTGEKYVTAGASSGIKIWSRRGGDATVISGARGCPWTVVEMLSDLYVLAGRADGRLALFDTRSSREPLAEHGADRGNSSEYVHCAALTALRRGPDNDYFSCAQVKTHTLRWLHQGEYARIAYAHMCTRAHRHTCQSSAVTHPSLLLRG